ncbi:MAG TPA: FkbM family methyltransferase [Verrucomicrobiae bacterium]|nr:FkbM family methyltransferase [Verrucomicrobiae bacterium]
MKIHKLKKTIKQQLRRVGFHLYTDGSLPHGVDVYVDLRRLRGGRRVETIFDIGANIGQTSLRLSEEFQSAKIFAFEPFKETFSQLSANTRHLRGVNTFNIALGELSEVRRVKIESGSVFNSLKTNREAGSCYEEEISVERLDSFCGRNDVKKIDFLKTDTEGFDLEVLRGGGDMVTSGVISSILCEVAFSPNNKQNTPFLSVFNYLTERGFRFHGLYDTFFLHRNSFDLAFCDALFCRPTFV